MSVEITIVHLFNELIYQHYIALTIKIFIGIAQKTIELLTFPVKCVNLEETNQITTKPKRGNCWSQQQTN